MGAGEDYFPLGARLLTCVVVAYEPVEQVREVNLLKNFVCSKV